MNTWAFLIYFILLKRCLMFQYKHSTKNKSACITRNNSGTQSSSNFYYFTTKILCIGMTIHNSWELKQLLQKV